MTTNNDYKCDEQRQLIVKSNSLLTRFSFLCIQHFNEKEKCHVENVTNKYKGYMKCKQWINANRYIF
jgi:hypothetical protein